MADRDALAKVELMIQDESLGELGIGLEEERNLRLPVSTTDRFLDGPVSRRVGVVDFDPATGRPLPAPATFVPFPRNPRKGSYSSPGLDADPGGFCAINAYGTVHQTMWMFEGKGGLGRAVQWAFGSEQLLVVPRAGEWANSVYDRDTHSLQFFWFQAGEQRIYTALSRDIVAHECGHALLDAVVPSLHDSPNPQALAIHEGIADLVAVLMAISSEKLRSKALERSDNSIDDITVFSSIAEEFGRANPSGGMPRAALRDLRNTDTMETVSHTNPHELCTVLSALFYDFLVATYKDIFQRATDHAVERGVDVGNAGAHSLGSAAMIFRRVVLRGLEYLPPGDLGFVDVGRATLAADLAGDPAPTESRTAARAAFAQRFVDRKIVRSADELATPIPRGLDVDRSSLVAIRDSDWAAYRYVEAHRDLFGVPADTPFEVLPRVDANKETRTLATENGRSRPVKRHELVLKVAWNVEEDSAVAGVNARRRRLRAGSTVSWAWSDGAAIACVKNDPRDDGQREARDSMLTELVARGLVEVVSIGDDDSDGGHSGAPVARPQIEVIDGVSRVRGTQRLLHLVRAW